MTTTTPTQQSVYVSQLHAELSPTLIADIARVSRQNNERTGVRAILLFDGERFCQWLCGEASALEQTLKRIVADQRHCEVSPLAYVQAEATSPAAAWQSGYVDPSVIDSMLRVRASDAEILESFFAACQKAELSD